MPLSFQHRLLPVAALALAAFATPATAASHDYPTHERVIYAIQCIAANGGAHALIYQCSCAIDKLARQFSYEEFVDMQTAANGLSMAGERGGELRDNDAVRANARRYRQSEQAALTACGVLRKSEPGAR